MSLGLIAGFTGGILIAAIGGTIFAIKRPKRLKVDRFMASWKELQGLCSDQAAWPLAITQADKLLDVALKKRKLKGKRMGERMVSAQRLLSKNDDIWFAHNLAKKLHSNAELKLKEADVKVALVGFRQALRDIGALPQEDAQPESKRTKDIKQ